MRHGYFYKIFFLYFRTSTPVVLLFSAAVLHNSLHNVHTSNRFVGGNLDTPSLTRFIFFCHITGSVTVSYGVVGTLKGYLVIAKVSVENKITDQYQIPVCL